ncbi:CO/xanthine dehydrogenase FAD-binding subunit [Bradyrhizobium ottawaense]
MRPFSYQRATDPDMAVQALSAAAAAASNPLTQATAQPLAGGTTLIDLMKLDVMRPAAIVDINPLAHAWSAIEPGSDSLRLGALAKMSDVAAHAEIQRNYPVIASSLKLAASAQLRNMATLGGNVMQRTRCSYFRDVSYENCNKRNPGSGCAAMDGVNRMHAVLGTSDQCIATYPGDFAQALIALDAVVEITGRAGTRTMPFAELHKAPGNSPDIETTLQPGELISAFSIRGPLASLGVSQGARPAILRVRTVLGCDRARRARGHDPGCARRARRRRHHALAGARGGGAAEGTKVRRSSGATRR